VKIADHEIGPAAPLFLVAEVGITAGGSVARACALVDAVAEAGAQAAKFIVTDPAQVMSRAEVPFTYETYALGATARMTRSLYGLLAETRMTRDQWRLVQAHCSTRGVVFFATTDHLAGVWLLEELDVPAYKLSAWDIAYTPLLDAMRATFKPVLVDVGTCTREELFRAIPDEHNLLFVHDPHPHEGRDWQMSRLRHFFRPDYPVGFASPGRESWCDFVALGGGACLIEKRLTLRRDEPTGHHHAISLEPDEFAAWVREIRVAEAALREDPFVGSEHAWAERKKYDRDENGRQG